MEISNPLPMDSMYTDQGVLVHCTRLLITPWNMDAIRDKTILHGIASGVARIISVIPYVWDDTFADYVYPLSRMGYGPSPDEIAGGIRLISDTQIVFTRLTGGFFDTVNFDSTAQDRGFAWIWYLE